LDRFAKAALSGGHLQLAGGIFVAIVNMRRSAVHIEAFGDPEIAPPILDEKKARKNAKLASDAPKKRGRPAKVVEVPRENTNGGTYDAPLFGQTGAELPEA
jgi:phosphoenolpyruvate synthase/pyruvate phosphate dikinase